jgi:hypothetical protein
MWGAGMTPGLIKMWISFISMGLMILAGLIILFGRYKLKGIAKMIFSFCSYVLFIFAALLMILVVL